MRSVLIDAGPLIALFAVDDHHHRRFDTLVTELSRHGLQLMTTWPCVVEASYLLTVPQRYELLRWLEAGGAVVYPFEERHLGEMVSWMERYAEVARREMDLADASLYWLACETGIVVIMTTDVADFTRYRLPNGRAFVLL
ncbi:PIN domain-containing protein [Candidatus Fermentibacteria bacterium]|nr:PIN domain-containing protein [Candidatus Fermentibacteria bacterium]